MDLKEMVLSALSDMEKNAGEITAKNAESAKNGEAETGEITAKVTQTSAKIVENAKKAEIVQVDTPAQAQSHSQALPISGELAFLGDIRERLLVLFEGFLTPNNQHIDAKLDLTLNFLEYLLAAVEDRVDLLKKI